MHFKAFYIYMARIVSTLEEAVTAIDTSYQEFVKEVTAYQEKNNKSANRRARMASLDLRDFLKQFKALSTEADKEAKGE